MPEALALIVNYFSADSVAALTQSLAEHRGDCGLTVSVIDNSCDDAEWQKLSEAMDGVRVGDRGPILTRSDANLGYAGGNNAAYAAAERAPHDAVFVINPDCAVAGGDFGLATEEVATHPDVLFGAPTLSAGRSLSGLAEISLPTGRSREIDSDSLEITPRRAVRYPSGHFLATSTDTWKKAGGFSEDYFLYSEEADLVLRLETEGVSTGVLEAIAVTHTGGGTTGSGPEKRRSPVTLFHAGRSRILLFRKHPRLRRWLPTALLSRVIWSFGFLARGRVRDFMSIQRGLLSALRAKPG